jgi:ribosome-associated protein
MLSINNDIQILSDEYAITFARSGGPGGQNVNKVNSKAVLRWTVYGSRSLPYDVLARFIDKYRNRLTSDGELILTSQRYRDQGRNVDDCVVKLREMILTVLSPPVKRRPTKPTRSSVKRREEAKRQQSRKKEQRRSAGQFE